MRHPNSTIFAALLILALLDAGCRQDQGQSSLSTARMKIGRKTFVVELALTKAAQEKGLMHRDSMPPDHGMLFVFNTEEPLQFWMKETRIPLDILFLDHTGNVTTIDHMKPYDLNTTPSNGPAMYAIELNEGAAAESGVQVGDRLELPQAAHLAAR